MSENQQTETEKSTEKTTDEMIDEALKSGDSSDNKDTDKDKPSSEESSSSSDKKPEDKKEEGFWSKLKNSLKGDNSKEAEKLRNEIEVRDNQMSDLLKENEQLKEKNKTLEDATVKVLSRVEALENKSKQSEQTSKQEQIKEQILLAKKIGALKPNDTEQEKVLIQMLANDYENTVKFISRMVSSAGSLTDDRSLSEAEGKTGETYAEKMAKEILNQYY
jgi:predicted nuclease with TOPRIM domain